MTANEAKQFFKDVVKQVKINEENNNKFINHFNKHDVMLDLQKTTIETPNLGSFRQGTNLLESSNLKSHLNKNEIEVLRKNILNEHHQSVQKIHGWGSPYFMMQNKHSQMPDIRLQFNEFDKLYKNKIASSICNGDMK